MLKGRQSGGMHRSHSWVFRAESHETMVAWIEAIRSLTEKTGAERNAFVRQHARSVSGNSNRPVSISSDGDGLEEDEADKVPYAASVATQQVAEPVEENKLKRPAPGEYVLTLSLRSSVVERQVSNMLCEQGADFRLI